MTDYNINAVTRRVVFSGSAGVGPYAFSFEVLEQSDVAVYFNTTKLTITTDYTVTINANGTGSVTIVTGTNVPSTPDADDTITIVGARDIERVTDFVTAGDLLASSLNEQFDALTIFDQQLAEENKRNLTAPVTDPAHVDDGGTLDMTLPSKADRAGRFLKFNETTGNPEAGDKISEKYTVSATAPTVDVEVGDLWFNTTDNQFYVRTASGWTVVATNVNGTSSRNSYTATAGQTTFAATYDVGYVDVYLNGVKLVDGTDFTASNGTSVVLASGAALNDTVDIVGYGLFTLLNSQLNDLNNVNVTSPADGTIIEYNSATSKYEKSGVLSVRGANGIIVSGGDSGVTETGQLFIEDNGGCLVYLASPNTNSGIINFADPEDDNVGQIKYDHSTNEMSFTTNATQQAIIDSSGRLGLGATPDGGEPNALIISGGDSGVTHTGQLFVEDDGNSGVYICSPNTSQCSINFGDPEDDNVGRVFYDHSSDELRFSTNGSVQGRFNSSGDFLVGANDASAAGQSGVVLGAADRLTSFNRDSDVVARFRRDGSTGDVITFYKDATKVGSISVTASTTAYNTTSDYRLKQDVVPISNATARLNQLNPVRFSFTHAPTTTYDGFLAHEVSAVVPEAVIGAKDAVDADGNIDPQGLDQSKLVPLLVATIKELEARITALENN